MRPHQTIDPHLSKKILSKTSSAIAGQKEPIFQEPFAHTRFIALREMLEHVILPAKGKSLEDFPQVKKLIDTGIRISSHQAISQTTEESRFNLKVAAHLQDTEEGDIIEIEI